MKIEYTIFDVVFFPGSSTPKRRRLSKANCEKDVKTLQMEVLELQKENALLQREALHKFINLMDRVSQHSFFSS